MRGDGEQLSLGEEIKGYLKIVNTSILDRNNLKDIQQDVSVDSEQQPLFS